MSLADRFIEHYEQGVFNEAKQDFLPQHCLAQLITNETIVMEFQEEDIDDTKYDPRRESDQQLLAFILEHARKVFATTVLCEISGNKLYRTMMTFQKSKVQDKSLPLKNETLSTTLTGSVWSNLKKKNFWEKQFIFLAPIFSKSEFKLDLEAQHIFPFTWVSNDAKEGTFSQVYQVKIHDSHHDMIVSLHQ